MFLMKRRSIIIFLLINLVSYITSLNHERRNSNDGLSLNKLIKMIVDSGRRGFKSSRNGPRDGIRYLRNGDDEANQKDDQQAVLIESELNEALAYKKSALFDRPHVETHGKNDFLVLQADNVGDPFVTIVPNALFYNVEKKCVNWLDDCNLQGIHHKFLQNIRYKK